MIGLRCILIDCLSSAISLRASRSNRADSTLGTLWSYRSNSAINPLTSIHPTDTLGTALLCPIANIRGNICTSDTAVSVKLILPTAKCCPMANIHYHINMLDPVA